MRRALTRLGQQRHRLQQRCPIIGLRYNSTPSSNNGINGIRQIVPLSDVGVIRLEGTGALTFLQNQMTQDIHDVITRTNAYSLFLNRQGRVLHDAIITHIPSSPSTPTASSTTAAVTKGPLRSETFLLQTSAVAVPSLLAHLRLFLLRSKVVITDETKQCRVWAALPSAVPTSPSPSSQSTATSIAWPHIPSLVASSLKWGAAHIDPRCAALGMRVILPHDVTRM
jgi:folate-binding Fe-S cluster repair protein YgfZ